MYAEDAGIGDPQWYEWTVGLLRVVEMLDPDSLIAAVTFQWRGVKGLDDVVVTYSDGRADEAIQVKHTRVGDTLTFGDLVTPGPNGQSLLTHLALSWRDMSARGNKYRAVLYSNRSAGATRASVTPPIGEPYLRPALADFWEWLVPRLRNATELSDIEVPSEWNRAWQEWVDAVGPLGSDSERLEFLKSLEVCPDQPGLKDLHAQVVTNLSKRFGVTSEQGRALAQALDGALRTWTTSLRPKEQVTVEDVMEALSPPEAGLPRDHALAPPAPFFRSRDSFVEDLGSALKSRAAPVVFLSGPPGCGKTSIVSALANRHDAVVLLRFHAFRPITPGDTLLPEDAGRATTTRALWGDYLSQLRGLLRGRLARFEVPIRNEFLSESQLREHVLRLASLWAAETGTIAVLAIDGLDHAARSRDPHHASLLESLPSPDSVPASVALLVAGQPPAGNPEYPVWLRGPHPQVLARQVPDIALVDIAAALAAQKTALPAAEHGAAHRVIAQFAGGNTLSAMFGIYEAVTCSTAQELADRLQVRKLSDGLSAYYDAIWSKAVKEAETVEPFLGAHVAAAFSLTSAPISASLLCRVFPSIRLGVEQWHELLSRLTPLVVEASDGFRLHHNDVRVHLMRQLQSQQPIIQHTASGLARTYLADPVLVRQKHAQAVNLFALCQDWGAIATLITPGHVLEGWVIGRSPDEVGEDLAQAFRAVTHTKNWSLLHQVCCAALTLRQLRHSAAAVSPSDECSPGLMTVPPILPSEARVAPKAEWTGQLIRDVVRDAWTLIRHSQGDRARQLLQRWFADQGPSSIASTVPDEDRQVRQSDLSPALELWGRACAHVGRLWQVGQGDESGRDTLAEAAFLSGELDEAVRLGGLRRIDAALQSGSGCDPDRISSALETLLYAGRWREVVPFLRKLRSDVPSPLRLRLALASLITRRSRRSSELLDSFLTSRFEALSDARDSMDAVAHHVWLCVLLGWMERTTREPSAIRDECFDSATSRRVDSRDRAALGILFGSAAALGRALGALVEAGASSADAYLSPAALAKMIQLVLDTFSAPRLHLPLGAHPAAVAVVRLATLMSGKVGPSHASQVSEVLTSYVGKHPLGPFEDSAWQHLVEHSPDALGRWVHAVLGEGGIAWGLSGTERIDVAQRFSTRAQGTAHAQACESALERMRWGVVSYADHKDYSLDTPLQWFKCQAQLSAQSWATEGIRLLAISQEAEEIGDNRLDTEVASAVFDAACEDGPSSVARLLRACAAGARGALLQVSGTSIVPEAFARVAKRVTPRPDELGVMWCWSIGCLAWQEDRDRGALVQIRDSLLAAASRLGLAGFADEMRVLAPLEFSLSAGAGKSGPDARPPEPEPPSTLEQAERLFGVSPESSPRLLLPLIREAFGAHDRASRMERILRILARREQRYGWSFSGSLPAYEALLPQLSEDERWGLITHWVETRPFDSQDLWLDQARDIDALCRIRAQVEGLVEVSAGTQRLLAMHELWRDGAGHLPAIAIPQIPMDSAESSWAGLALTELLSALDLNGVLDVETALRGLFALCTVDSGAALALASRATTSTTRVVSAVLFILERLAATAPESARATLPLIKQAARATDLPTRLQAWVVVQQLTRSGVECEGVLPSPLFPTGTPSELVLPPRPLLTFDESSAGRLNFGEPVLLVRHLLERVAHVTGEEVEELESALSASLPDELSSKAESKRKTRHWDIQLRDSPIMDAALRFLNDRANSGRWEGAPVAAVAQAVLLNDDPWVLLRTPDPTPSVSGWVIDDDLDKAIARGDQQSVMESLSRLIGVGLSENELILGGMLSTYSRNWDLELHLAFGPERRTIRQNAPVASTFGGRAYSWYAPDCYQAGAQGWLTLHHGGLMQVPDQTFNVVPSKIWTSVLKWRPAPRNPAQWYSADGEAIRFERLVGPHRSVVREPLERQPVIHRWVCTRETWERALRALPFPVALHSHYRLEHPPAY